MSGDPRPKGREFNPKGTLVGTQAFRVVNVVFVAFCAVSAGVGYYLITKHIPNSRFYKWLSSDKTLEQDVELKQTQAVLQRIRYAKRVAEDPYYMYTKDNKKEEPRSPISSPFSAKEVEKPSATKSGSSEATS